MERKLQPKTATPHGPGKQHYAKIHDCCTIDSQYHLCALPILPD